jgi:hypothetical protein
MSEKDMCWLHRITIMKSMITRGRQGEGAEGSKMTEVAGTRSSLPGVKRSRGLRLDVLCMAEEFSLRAFVH